MKNATNYVGGHKMIAMLLLVTMMPFAALAGTMTPLPGVGNADEIAWDVNDAGVIVGTAYFGGLNQTALRWENGVLELLDGPLFFDGQECLVLVGDARHVSEAGTVAGQIVANCSGVLVFRTATWNDNLGLWEPLPVPVGAAASLGVAGNRNGDIAYRVFEAGSFSTLVYDASTASTTPLAGTESCAVFALNNQGLATGFCGPTAMAWFDGDSIELGGKNGERNYGRGLNDNGTIAGVISFDRTDGNLFHFPARAAVWDLMQPNKPAILRTGWATDVNNDEIVVGSSGYDSNLPDAPNHHAAMWSGNRLIELGTLGGPASLARAINENGVVVGQSDNTNLLGSIVVDGVVIEFYEVDAFVWEP